MSWVGKKKGPDPNGMTSEGKLPLLAVPYTVRIWPGILTDSVVGTVVDGCMGLSLRGGGPELILWVPEYDICGSKGLTDVSSLPLVSSICTSISSLFSFCFLSPLFFLSFFVLFFFGG